MRVHGQRQKLHLLVGSLEALLLLLLLLLVFHLRPSAADIGTASYYNPPYLPTACFQNDPTQFPAGNMFAAAGDGIWDGGAACGRRYLVNCLNPAGNSTGECKPGRQVRVRIVDHAASLVSPPASPGATIVLSTAAFSAIADTSAAIVNIDFIQDGSLASTRKKDNP